MVGQYKLVSIQYTSHSLLLTAMESAAEFASKFNTATYPKTKRLLDLEIGKPYQLVGMKKATTRFGPAIVSRLQDGDEQFDVFLPTRYEAVFSEAELNSTDYSKLNLIFDGSVTIIPK